ncbi:hypothetical protein QBC33DRAFT_246239 [Phialemonium atrogriseum]|uniref:Uncharacterized protein n=1 Tax=Phialemonium atrogriseum TaxID=1093897 RepID=A0AAJ0BRS8_9PEZI|nr:uncharacterized protein QBC33DRAFT_246239 [Phialemonium atrogriseum]KAK1763295.1 hypothetical protein QBC33DRAFT_246239 [Phialemonium atrogriseum]
MSDFRGRASALLERLEASRLLLVEWETSLHIRLGYPLASNGSLFLLIPDGQLQRVRELAAGVGLSPADENTLRSIYPCELSGLAVRYLVDDSFRTAAPHEGPPRRRLVFLSMSWTGITPDELVPISAQDASQPTLPSFVQTMPLPVACAALVRIAAREKRGSPLREGVIERLSSIIGYSLFDMSYEGDYMEFPPNDQPLSDQETLEIQNAVVKMNKCVFREDEEWIKEILVQIVSGKMDYVDLPCQERPRM